MAKRPRWPASAAWSTWPSALTLRFVSEPVLSYVEAERPIAVRVTVPDGSVRDGQVLGWRGDRVCVSWRTGDGTHLGWVDARVVERVPPSPDELGPRSGVGDAGRLRRADRSDLQQLP